MTENEDIKSTKFDFFSSRKICQALVTFDLELSYPT
jgi:hypothetical protein